MFSKYIFLLVILAGAQAVGQLHQSDTPFQFVLRDDVKREIRVSNEQINLIDRMQPVCDAQCKAKLMEIVKSAGTDLQSQFLALDDDTRNAALDNLEKPIREQIETETLTDKVLTPEQAERFLQLRTQFRGIGSLLDDRVSDLMGLDDDQQSELKEIQMFGGELINECTANSNLTPDQQRAAIVNINNVLIDQSINILNDSQVSIFIGLCGKVCQFDPPDPPISNQTETPDANSIQPPDDDVAGENTKPVSASQNSSLTPENGMDRRNTLERESDSSR